ncbi:MAG TPA: hypothetical protein GXZ98_01580 [Firmicutes bacterium]|jgi:hypothetical protein|nr:hypothetical protein [Bacillota bacterium]
MSKLYPYPAVQYIPLSFSLIFRQHIPPLHPFILSGADITAQQDIIAGKFGVQLPKFKETADQLFLLVGGFEPLEIKYRGYYVTIKALPHPSLSLLSLPKRYFYKNTLVFQAKKENGDLLVAKAYHYRSLKVSPS